MVEKCSTARTGHVAGQEVLIVSQPAAKKGVDVKKNPNVPKHVRSSELLISFILVNRGNDLV